LAHHSLTYLTVWYEAAWGRVRNRPHRSGLLTWRHPKQTTDQDPSHCGCAIDWLDWLDWLHFRHTRNQASRRKSSFLQKFRVAGIKTAVFNFLDGHVIPVGCFGGTLPNLPDMLTMRKLSMHWPPAPEAQRGKSKH
jgi:hypothetical protein